VTIIVKIVSSLLQIAIVAKKCMHFGQDPLVKYAHKDNMVLINLVVLTALMIALNVRILTHAFNVIMYTLF